MNAHLSGNVLSILSEDAAAQEHLAEREKKQKRKNTNNPSVTERIRSGSRAQSQGSASPVGHLLQVHLLVVVEQLGDVMPDDPHEEGDEDDGQHHPQPDAGVQQELRTGHRSLALRFNQSETQAGRASGRAAELEPEPRSDTRRELTELLSKGGVSTICSLQNGSFITFLPR